MKKALGAYRHSPLSVKLRAWGSVKTRRLLELEEFLPKTGTILDYGAGDGLFSRFLVEAADERKIIAIEPDSRRLAIAKALHERSTRGKIIFISSLDDISPQQKFSAIVILDVLYLIPPQKRAALANRLRQLFLPGGILILKELVLPVHGIQLLGIWQEIMATKLGYTLHKGLHFLSAVNMEEFAKQAGCLARIIPMPRLWYNHYATVAKKQT